MDESHSNSRPESVAFPPISSAKQRQSNEPVPRTEPKSHNDSSGMTLPKTMNKPYTPKVKSRHERGPQKTFETAPKFPESKASTNLSNDSSLNKYCKYITVCHQFVFYFIL